MNDGIQFRTLPNGGLTDAEMKKLKKAVAAYALLAPAKGRYAVGARSAKVGFMEILEEPVTYYIQYVGIREN